jgi:hypothetical protein
MSWRDHLKEFAKECLFFQSREAINWMYGVLEWSSLFLFVYAMKNLIETYQF